MRISILYFYADLMLFLFVSEERHSGERFKLYFKPVFERTFTSDVAEMVHTIVQSVCIDCIAESATVFQFSRLKPSNTRH